jgi:hypothetical protein
MSDYLELRNALETHVQQYDEVLALVWAGSAADTKRIDAWSDHDFFLIVNDGHAERFRSDLFWLPMRESIAWEVRETDHGYKVVYRNGQVLEFAVFDRAELAAARVNHFALAFDKAEVEKVVRGVFTPNPPSRYTPQANLEIFFTLLIIGVGRFRRGEVLSAGQFVRVYAVDHLLQAIKKTHDSSKAEARDGLDVYRRVEQEFPELGTQIGVAIAQDAESAAQALLGIAVQEFAEGIDVVRVGESIVKQIFDWS